MSRPGRLWRVEWSAARTFTTPNDRADHSRLYSTATAAARQVRAVQMWPTHMALLGVAVTVGWEDGLRWEPLDPSDLPRLPDHVEQRFRALEEARLSHPDPAVRAAYFPREDDHAHETNH